MSKVNQSCLYLWKRVNNSTFHNFSFLTFVFVLIRVFIFIWNVFFFFNRWPNWILYFLQTSFFHGKPSSSTFIPLSLPSAYSPTSVCGVLLCTLGICCFKSCLLCITSLLNQTAMSFQEGLFLLVLWVCVVPSCLPPGAWVMLWYVCCVYVSLCVSVCRYVVMCVCVLEVMFLFL